MPRTRKTFARAVEPSCVLKMLPTDLHLEAAVTAIDVNPLNKPNVQGLGRFSVSLGAEFLAVVTTKYWGVGGVKLGVSFLDSPPADLKARILAHMNAWSTYCNVSFHESSQGEVRLSRTGDGYWSYLGTDILHIPAGQPTMNLQGFTMSTPEAEYHRVVRHEVGHTLGMPHEHLRKALIDLLDPAKTIAWGSRVLGWSASMVTQQILTPVNESSLISTPDADQDSIMCYQLPGECTRSGQPIRGGTDIDVMDQAFAARIYPREVVPPPPPPPPPPKPNGGSMTRDDLRARITTFADVLDKVALFMFGPLAWVKTTLTAASALLRFIASSDVILDLILVALNRGALPAVAAAPSPTPQQMAALGA